MTDVPPPSAPSSADAPGSDTGGKLSLSKTQVTSARLFGRPETVPPASATVPASVTGPVSATVPEITTLGVRFTGQAGEYFRIWIVNVLLSVVTLGIYSPWARVRTRQYFYGHAWLDGHNFEYTARPIALLRGFLLVGALFVVYTVTQQVERLQWIRFLLLGLFGVLYPWLVYRSLKFNAANTVYRGLNFHFHGKAGAAYVAYLFVMFTVPFTLGLTYPLAIWMQRRYVLEHAAYGTARARWGKEAGPVYIIFLTALGVSIGLGTLIAVIAGIAVAVTGASGGFESLGTVLGGLGQTGTSGKGHGQGGSGAGLAGALLIGGIALLYLTFILASLTLQQYIRAALLKFSLHDLYIGPTLRLQATFNPVRLAWISSSNLVAQLFTLGLLTPWAAVRHTRYLLEGVQVQTIAGLGDFAADATPTESALGEAAHEFFNFDLGF